MPYRRLPNTDTARLKAIEKAISSCSNRQNTSPLQEDFLRDIRLLHTDFKQAVDEYRNSFNKQRKNKNIHKKNTHKCKLYISHFIQVMNFAVLREEFPKTIKKYYNLKVDTMTLPKIQTEKQIIKWGEILVEGEQKRLLEGGQPILNPSLANLKNNVELFIDSYYLQKDLIKKTNRYQKKLVEIRPKIDLMIRQIWDKIEKFYEKYPAIIRREKAKIFGINYVYRKNEEKIELDDLLNFG